MQTQKILCYDLQIQGLRIEADYNIAFATTRKDSYLKTASPEWPPSEARTRHTRTIFAAAPPPGRGRGVAAAAPRAVAPPERRAVTRQDRKGDPFPLHLPSCSFRAGSEGGGRGTAVSRQGGCASSRRTVREDGTIVPTGLLTSVG
jgi:hypothetical protein